MPWICWDCGWISLGIPPHNSTLWSCFSIASPVFEAILGLLLISFFFSLSQFLLCFSSVCSPWRTPILFSPICLRVFCFWNLLWQLIAGSSESEKSHRIYKINLVSCPQSCFIRCCVTQAEPVSKSNFHCGTMRLERPVGFRGTNICSGDVMQTPSAVNSPSKKVVWALSTHFCPWQYNLWVIRLRIPISRYFPQTLL